MQKLLSASLMALGVMTTMSAYANPDLRTTNAANWQARYLGENWQAPLNTMYEGVYEVTPNNSWATANGLSWISPYPDTMGPDGYYSYMTIITDDLGWLGSDQSAVFEKLTITHSSDNRFEAVIINGVHYADLSPQAGGYNAFGGFATNDVVGIDWNIGSPNTIEFIVYNGIGSGPNPTGFAAGIQATYSITAIPEPETYAMMLAGLGIVGAIARRRRIK